MEFKKPKVLVIGEPHINYDALLEYFEHMGAEKWYVDNIEDPDADDLPTDLEILSEVYSRSCYKSFGVGLNPNITKVRDGNDVHLWWTNKSGEIRSRIDDMKRDIL